MSAPTENEILREARRVFFKLCAPHARLKLAKRGRFEVVSHRDSRSGRTRTTEVMVAEFRKRGWLAPLPDDSASLSLTDAGRRLLDHRQPGEPLAAPHGMLSFREIRDRDGAAIVVAVNDAESPLDWLKARGAITDLQHDAGERLRRDYTIARLEPRLCTDLTAPVVNSSGRGAENAGMLSDTVLAAKQRLAAAMKAVGPGLSDLLFDVCCALKGLEAIETAKAWPRRSGKVVLALALDRLADHYGMARKPPKARPRIRGWTAETGWPGQG
ncbi:MAG TPA: DUF6456 domain-containing protein [Rhizomicrobium sp.]|nr:DUF6456 domain-containing protein [Rhizomicrobium sp.]